MKEKHFQASVKVRTNIQTLVLSALFNASISLILKVIFVNVNDFLLTIDEKNLNSMPEIQ